MFNQPQNPSPNPPALKKPPIGEPEDILNDIDPVSAQRQPINMKSATAGITKKVAPPPNLGSIAAPLDAKEKTIGAKDIFSTLGPSAQKPSMPQGINFKEDIKAVPVQHPDIERRKPLLKSKIFITAILAVLGVGALAVAGFYLYNQLNKPVEQKNNADSNELLMNTAIAPTPPPTPTPAFIDSDLDGLSDDEEKMYGTDPNQVDTDGDELTDRDEIKTWKTDPLNPDTDKDGYKDGEEVINKYNPLGSGKLIELPN